MFWMEKSLTWETRYRSSNSDCVFNFIGMGKASRGKRHRNRAAESSMPYEKDGRAGHAASATQSRLVADLSSLSEERRLKACHILSSVFAQNADAVDIPYEQLCSDQLLSQLRSRLVESSPSVRLAAAGAVRFNQSH
jgi:hypothetical protein